nr:MULTISPECIES: IucA/IucC family protein [unclassified Frankia]
MAYEELLSPQPDEPADAAAGPAGSPGGPPPTAPARTSDPAVRGVTPDGRRHPPIGRGPIQGYRLRAGGVTYAFTARRGTFGSWWIDAATLTRSVTPPGPDGSPPEPGTAPTVPGTAPADDPIRFLQDMQVLLGWSDPVLADVVRDLLATQAADHHLLGTAIPAVDLADLPFVALDGYQTGHPCLVANKGRLGFGAAAAVYAPEARRPFRLRWVAAHRAIGRYSAIAPKAIDLSGQGAPTVPDLLTTELDEQTRAHFTDVLRGALPDEPRRPGPAPLSAPPAGPPAGTTIADYVWLPVHPWQWENVIVPLYAAEIATGLLVPLGEAPDRYLPLQAVRTLANVDRPDRRNVKLALMIRNTLVWRGMSAADAIAGPAMSSWLLGLRDADPFLRDVTRVLPLPEVAGATVRHPAYDAVPDAPYRLHELLGVLWRDPVERFLDGGERARSLASLLAVGSDGRAVVAELVARSGRPAHDWLAALFAALLPPLLHYLYRYGVAFTPHGENVLCIFDAEEMPRRIAVKDFGADIELVSGEFPERRGMPPEAVEHCRRWPGPVLAHSLLSAVFAGHFRFFAVLVADHLDVDENQFWRLVRATVDQYHARFPALRERFASIDLLGPAFGRVCLNREQFAGAGFHDRADRDGGFDLIHGEVANPLHDVSTLTTGPARPAAPTEPAPPTA